MIETPQQRADVVFCQYVLARQQQRDYPEFLRSLRLRIDSELVMIYDQTTAVGHALAVWPTGCLAE